MELDRRVDAPTEPAIDAPEHTTGASRAAAHENEWRHKTRPATPPRLTWTRRTQRPNALVAGLLAVACLLAVGCAGTGTTRRNTTDTAHPLRPGVATTTPATSLSGGLSGTTWQGAFQVRGGLENSPAHVSSASCAAIGSMALALRPAGSVANRGSSVSGHVRVWAVIMSGRGCGSTGRASRLETVSSDGSALRASRLHLLGIAYDWLTVSVTGPPAAPALRGQFGVGGSGRRALRGNFVLQATPHGIR
jgi:hypothetical protein